MPTGENLVANNLLAYEYGHVKISSEVEGIKMETGRKKEKQDEWNGQRK